MLFCLETGCCCVRLIDVAPGLVREQGWHKSAYVCRTTQDNRVGWHGTGHSIRYILQPPSTLGSIEDYLTLLTHFL